MTHRLINLAIAAAILLTLIGIQVLDASDLESEMQTEQREWITAVSICHRAYGPSTQPEYNESGRLVCVSRRGEVLPYRVASK